MCIITRENLESSNRPADRPWTPAENRRYLAGRMETIKAAMKRVAAKENAKVFALASPSEVITFRIKASSVVITRTDTIRASRREAIAPQEVTLDEARQEYKRFLDHGYWAW